MTSARYHGSSPLRYTSDVDLAKVAVPGICLAADSIVKVQTRGLHLLSIGVWQVGESLHPIAMGSGVLQPCFETSLCSFIGI